MSKELLPTAIGLALLCLAAFILVGWSVPNSGLLTSVPLLVTSINSTVCLELAAIALFADSWAQKWRVLTQSALGLGIIILASAVLSQHIFAIDLGIDWANQQRWLPNNNPHPGRMPIMTCVGFLLVGAVLILKHRVASAIGIFTLSGLNLAIGVIAIFAVVGRVLGLRSLYKQFAVLMMATPTATILFVLAVTLWLTWRSEPWNRPIFIKSDVGRLLLASTAVMTTIAIVCGLSTLIVMETGAVNLETQALVHTLQNRVATLTAIIPPYVQEFEHITSDPVFIATVKGVTADQSKQQDQRVQALIRYVESRGFSGIAIADSRNEIIMKSSHFLANPDVSLLMTQLPSTTALLWGKRYLLQNKFSPEGSDETIILQQAISEISLMLSDISEIGPTGELLICAPDGKRTACLPTRLRPRPIFYPFKTRLLPVQLALRGESGQVTNYDSRGNEAMFAYQPATTLGLGLVLRENTEDLYKSIRTDLLYLLPFVVVLLGTGVLIMRWAILPFARRLAIGDQRLQLALTGSKLALWDLDLTTGHVYLSEQWQTILGGTPGPTATTLSELNQMVHADDQAAVTQRLRAAVKDPQGQYDVEHRVRMLTGEWKWIHSVGKVVERTKNGRALRLTGTNADVDERKVAELQIAHQATHDSLTGLPNRALFHDRVKQAIARSRRRHCLLSVMYLDLDKFKSVNDTMGHATGDLLLKAFAIRLSQCVRQTDTVGRLGGDEFAILLEELVNREAGLIIATKILEAMRLEFICDGLTINTRTSIGITFFDGSGEVTAEKLINQADRALYEAKGAGRDRFREACSDW